MSGPMPAPSYPHCDRCSSHQYLNISTLNYICQLFSQSFRILIKIGYTYLCMLISVNLEEKSFGNKRLFDNVNFSIQDGEKIGLIGRNGAGKSTLFHVITGDDKDFQGEVIAKRGTSIISTRQEHHGHEDSVVIDYILHDLPEYSKLKHIMDTLPLTMGDNMRLINDYSQALERFEQMGYYTIEDEVNQLLAKFQLPDDVGARTIGSLSGGQKRLIEIAKVMQANAHVALIDEPTNHMDYVAKAAFIDWMKGAREAMLIITHDRDVLKEVDRIIEMKDMKTVSFKGNYDAYLSQNARDTSNQMNEHELVQRRITNLKQKIIDYQRMKEKSRDPGTIQKFKRLEMTSREELATLSAKEKPTFWIDKGSVEQLGLKTGTQYEKFKAKTIKIAGAKEVEGHSRLLVEAKSLRLGYGEKPLFENINFQLREGETMELRGRNGAGKTTLIKTLLAYAAGTELPAKVFDGYIETDSKLTIGVYEQEVSPELFDKTLETAIETIYLSRGLSVSETKVRNLMADYLFEVGDKDVPVKLLSGGQKARLQLIEMMANNPSLLVLDEPTNHLDLPSIEEMELALKRFKGSILFVSHDSYFQKALGGSVVKVG